jgi:hypothetical protein
VRNAEALAYRRDGETLRAGFRPQSMIDRCCLNPIRARGGGKEQESKAIRTAGDCDPDRLRRRDQCVEVSTEAIDE